MLRPIVKKVIINQLVTSLPIKINISILNTILFPIAFGHVFFSLFSYRYINVQMKKYKQKIFTLGIITGWSNSFLPEEWNLVGNKWPYVKLLISNIGMLNLSIPTILGSAPVLIKFNEGYTNEHIVHICQNFPFSRMPRFQVFEAIIESVHVFRSVFNGGDPPTTALGQLLSPRIQ